MHLLLFGILLIVVLIVALIFIGSYFEFEGTTTLICMAVIVLGCLSIPNVIFDEKATYVESSSQTYELLKNDYVAPHSGKYAGIAICYINDNGELTRHNASGSKVYYHDDVSQIQFIKAKWGFLYETKTILYLNKEE